MRFQKLGAIALVGFVVTSSFAGYKIRAAVLPSVNEHIDKARIKAQLGSYEEASGYAKAMLMEDQITVSVDYGNTPDNQKTWCDTAVAGAFDMWEKALGKEIKFVRVESKDAPHVRIKFDKDVTLNGGIVSGYINWSRSIEETKEGFRPVFSADVFLRTTDPRGTKLSAKAMKHTCGHELGHMFGLDDASRVGILMGPLDVNNPVSAPSADEIETVMAIREECKLLAKHGSSGQHAQYFGKPCQHQDHHH